MIIFHLTDDDKPADPMYPTELVDRILDRKVEKVQAKDIKVGDAIILNTYDDEDENDEPFDQIFKVERIEHAEIATEKAIFATNLVPPVLPAIKQKIEEKELFDKRLKDAENALTWFAIWIVVITFIIAVVSIAAYQLLTQQKNHNQELERITGAVEGIHRRLDIQGRDMRTLEIAMQDNSNRVDVLRTLLRIQQEDLQKLQGKNPEVHDIPPLDLNKMLDKLRIDAQEVIDRRRKLLMEKK